MLEHWGNGAASVLQSIAKYTGGTSGAYVYSDPITRQALMLTTSSDISGLYGWDGLGGC